MQSGEELFDARIGDPVPQRLAFAPVRNETFITHFGEMLRERGLGQTDRLSKRINVGLPPLYQLAQDHEPSLVGERPQNVRHFGCFHLEGFRIERLLRHLLALLN